MVRRIQQGGEAGTGTRERLSTRTLLKVGAAVGVVSIAAACLYNDDPYRDPVDGPARYVVAVDGDSTLRQAEGGGGNSDNGNRFLVDELLERRYRATSTAQVGRKTDHLNEIQWPEGENPDIAVAVLGTNDSGDKDANGEPIIPLEVSEQNIRDYAERMWPEGDDEGCLVLVEVPSSTHPDWRTDLTAPAYNQMLEGVVTDINGVIVRWNSKVGANPDLMESDGIHPSALGEAEYVQDIADAVDDCAEILDEQEPVPTTTTTTEPVTTTTEPVTTTTEPFPTTTSTSIPE